MLDSAKKSTLTIGVSSCLRCFFATPTGAANPEARCEIGQRQLGGNQLMLSLARKPRRFDTSEISEGYPLPNTSPAWCPLREMDVTVAFIGPLPETKA